MFFGRNDAKAETPVLWPPHAKSWFIGKDSDAGRDWGQEEKGVTEDEMAGWHHRLDGRGFRWELVVGREAWRAAIHGVANSWTWLSDWTDWLTDWLWKSINIFYYCDYVTITHLIGEGHDNPLQYSCLENPMDRGAWWATVHGVTKSRTLLKRLSTHLIPLYHDWPTEK